MSRSSVGEPKPYGFVLVLRGLARAAIKLDNHPAALRVLCVAAEYMNQDGLCRISQGTIAARLGISRQAVNRHLALLDQLEILVGGAAKDGVTRRYILDTENLENEREGQHRVDARNAKKKVEKPEPFDSVQSKAARMANNQHLFEERIGYPVFLEQDVSKGFAIAEAAMSAYEASQGFEYRKNENVDGKGPATYRLVHLEKATLAVVAGRDTASPEWAVNEIAKHHRFGLGRVEAVDGKKITVRFEAGSKTVVSGFIQRATSEVAGREHAPREKPAISEVAGGAT